MQTRTGLLAAIACCAIFFHHPSDLAAVGDNAVALTGKVTSADEGAMEGALVAHRDDEHPIGLELRAVTDLHDRQRRRAP